VDAAKTVVISAVPEKSGEKSAGAEKRGAGQDRQAGKGQVHAPQGIGALALDMTRAWASA